MHDKNVWNKKTFKMQGIGRGTTIDYYFCFDSSVNLYMLP